MYEVDEVVTIGLRVPSPLDPCLGWETGVKGTTEVEEEKDGSKKGESVSPSMGTTWVL